MELPSFLVDLIREFPPGPPQITTRVLGGDLELGVHWYAGSAEFHGSRGQWWRVWRELQRLRGKSLDEALAELTGDQRRWFAQWAFAHEEPAEGRLAYRRYLERPGKYGPFESDNVTYLDHLLADAQYTEVLETVDALEATYDDVPTERMRAVRAMVALGDVSAALERLDAVRDRHHDCGDLWALSALLHVRLKDAEAARRALQECAKLGIDDERLIRELLDALRLTPAEWHVLRAPYQPQQLSYEEEAREWRADPGARLKPSLHASPHRYGGEDFTMPACRGCGHPIHQWFLLDVREISPLRQRLPTWSFLPLLGCVDCMVWMGRHDYEVDLDGMRVKLVNVAISLTRYGEPFGEFPSVPAQSARLEWLPPIADPTAEDLEEYPDWDHPQVAGCPIWAQDPLRVFCKRCRQEMVFVAAMTTTSEFEPEVPINNESGFQYHFACDACHTLSVIAQWS